jgi:trimethylamine--corrinoid protein Co-methyltransferase
MNAEPRRRRSGGRANAREPAPIPQLAASHVRNPYPPMRVLSDDQVEAIHDASMHIL